MIMQPPPGERPPTLPRWAKWIAAPIMWVFGWKYGGGLPNIPKMVIIGVPHTTNWDGFWYLVITAYMRLRTNVIMKAEIARTPFVGWVFKKFGGIPVERSTSNNLVTQMAAEIAKRETIAIVIAPEGTRKRAEYWHAGFYWIAHRAHIPIVLAAIDYSIKSLDFLATIQTTGDIDADFRVIASLYEGHLNGKRPENIGPIRPKPGKVHKETE